MRVRSSFCRSGWQVAASEPTTERSRAFPERSHFGTWRFGTTGYGPLSASTSARRSPGMRSDDIDTEKNIPVPRDGPAIAGLDRMHGQDASGADTRSDAPRFGARARDIAA